MKAVVFHTKEKPLRVEEVDLPVPATGQVLIALHYAALNHLDLWIWDEQSLDTPVISGADGSGVVHTVGNGVDERWIGKEVIINPALYWGNGEKVYAETFQILGNPTNGTFAEWITIPVDYISEKPPHLSLKEAAALPLAALTAYRALFTKAQLTPLDKVLITGIGGGAALYLLQMTVAIGATVYVTSSSHEKLQKAVQWGAKDGYNYNDTGWVQKAKAAAGGFDVIIDSAGGNGFARLTEVANAGARIVLFGRTAGNINHLKPGLIFNKQLQILGTVMGSPREFEAMLAFYCQHKLKPIIDKEFALQDINVAREYMRSGKHCGKIILNIR
ncbi:MAG: zinc-binding dehydrogenase [Bacteroidota bacterium]|nr:zinc-binding dehydrogenase [Bacteroidota bacterium]